jgi:Tfp pilus assembly ATPase PilU
MFYNRKRENSLTKKGLSIIGTGTQSSSAVASCIQFTNSFLALHWITMVTRNRKKPDKLGEWLYDDR